MCVLREKYLFVKIIISSAFILVIILHAEAQECGTVYPNGKVVPWQAGIFERIYNRTYLRWRCGGTLISNKVIVTGAHLLLKHMSKDKKLPLHSIAVVVGNFPYFWTDPLNKNAQMSDVKEINFSPGFRQYSDPKVSHSYNYILENFALVIVTNPFSFNDYVRPACLDFDYDFELEQLREDSKGTVLGWSIPSNVYPDPTKDPDPKPQVKDLYTLGLETCATVESTNSYSDSKLYTLILSDRICVKAKENDSAPCVGDAGVGLAFPSTVNGVKRYYLRGIYTLAVNIDKACTTETYYAFTSLLKYERFIRKYWNDSVTEIPNQIGKCVLPPYPEHGTYTTNVTNVSGDEDFVVVALTVTCDQGYGVMGSNSIECYNGFWPKNIPSCIPMCQLKPHPSVEYRCLVAGNAVGSRDCSLLEPIGTIVNPRCREPDFYSATDLTFMRCKDDGHWDYVAKCSPECGKITPDGKELAVGGVRAKKGELPWHVGIYIKNTKPFMQICGGSLITNSLILSAAHCFWINQKLPASLFAVAVGKIYRSWNEPMDEAQKSDVMEIHMPKRYQGVNANFQDDIAVVKVANAFQYKPHVRPVCLSFDYNFDRLQLQTTNKGKVAGWGLTAANGKPSLVLQVLEMPYVEVGTCISNAPPDFVAFITSDKICAGDQQNNSALCKGDSGGGLAFPATDRGVVRHYLRGVVSTAPSNGNACNTETYTSFTQIIKHVDFIKSFLTEL